MLTPRYEPVVVPRLITIPISHYCERARWALDAVGADYEERQHLQLFAGIVTQRAGATHTVPALVLQSEVLRDSSDIVQWASRRSENALYPSCMNRTKIETAEAQFANDYGVETRRVAYQWFFRNLETCIQYNEGAAPRYQAWMLRIAKRWVVPRMSRYLQLSDTRVEQGRDLVLKTMDDVAEQISDGRPYLLGDDFSAADIAFATMTAPSVLPSQYAMPLPPLEALDEGVQDWITRMRAHPAGQFALRLYEERPSFRGVLSRELHKVSA